MLHLAHNKQPIKVKLPLLLLNRCCLGSCFSEADSETRRDLITGRVARRAASTSPCRGVRKVGTHRQGHRASQGKEFPSTAGSLH